MSKHTGGDWTADTDEIDNCSDVHAEGSEPDGASLFICELHHPNHKADARLIAAAPELLEALGKALLRCEDCATCGPDIDCPQCAESWDILRRAKGEDNG